MGSPKISDIKKKKINGKTSKPNQKQWNGAISIHREGGFKTTIVILKKSWP